MKQILIGSECLNYWYPDFPRIPKDIDYAVDEECKSGFGVEYLYNPVLFKYTSFAEDMSVTTLEAGLLLSLKISHLFWNINWDKHMWDVQFLLSKGCQYNLEYIKEQIEFWNKYLPKVHRSDLKMTKDSFFNNAVNKDTDEHDLLHAKLVDYPAYKKLLKDGCDVELDESKWEYLTFEEKCDAVYEETAVMAFERYDPKLYWKAAFNRQLKDNIIKHFPFFIALFAIENYKIVSNPKLNYQLKLM